MLVDQEKWMIFLKNELCTFSTLNNDNNFDWIYEIYTTISITFLCNLYPYGLYCYAHQSNLTEDAMPWFMIDVIVGLLGSAHRWKIYLCMGIFVDPSPTFTNSFLKKKLHKFISNSARSIIHPIQLFMVTFKFQGIFEEAYILNSMHHQVFTLFFRESFNLLCPFFIIVIYYQTKTSIDFGVGENWTSNFKNFISWTNRNLLSNLYLQFEGSIEDIFMDGLLYM